jgi:hypothetical protein
MTQKEINKEIKKEFFTQVTNLYPESEIEMEEGGRYSISIPGYEFFQLQSGYWDICSSSIPYINPSKEQSEFHNKCMELEKELQELLNVIVSQKS